MHRVPPFPSPGTAPAWWTSFDPRLSLPARVALWLFAALAGGTLLTAWAAGALLERELRRQAEFRFETLAVQVTDKIDRTLYERYRGLQLLAELDTVRQAVAGGGDAASALRALLGTSPDFAWIGLASAEGRMLASAGLTRLLPDAAQQPWFRAARERAHLGGPHEIPHLERGPDLLAEDRVSYLDLSVPVARPDGQFGGVLAAHVRWDFARDIQLSVIAEPALRERVSATLYSGALEVIFDSRSSGWSAPPAAPALPETRRFRGAMIESTPEGPVFFTGFARSRGFREFRGLGWLGVVRQPLDRVLAPVGHLRRNIVGGGVVLTLLVTAVAWLVASRHARRLRSIAASAERIHEGDVLAVLPSARSQDEFGRMTDAVGRLVEHLRQQPPGTPSNAVQPDGAADVPRSRINRDGPRPW